MNFQKLFSFKEWFIEREEGRSIDLEHFHKRVGGTAVPFNFNINGKQYIYNIYTIFNIDTQHSDSFLKTVIKKSSGNAFSGFSGAKRFINISLLKKCVPGSSRLYRFIMFASFPTTF